MNADPFVWLADISDAPDWMAGIIWKKETTNHEGTSTVSYHPSSCSANASTILAADPRWGGVIGYDEFAEQVAIRKPPPWHGDDAGTADPLGPWREEDTTRAAVWLQRAYRISLSSNNVAELVTLAARRRPFHPVREWLAGIRWDGVQRLPAFFVDYFGAPDNAYTRFAGVSFMVSAIARIMVPGCKVDTVPILEGIQGLGKSSALRALVPEDWFLEFSGGIDGLDAMQQLRRKWIAELPELDALGKAEASKAKAFFSAQVDTYRASYGRHTRDYPRQCVFVGTVNKNRYFQDETGNRRYMPLACTKADRVGLAANRDQLWAEARARYDSSEKWHAEDPEVIDACQREQDARFVVDIWEALIDEWLHKPTDVGTRATLGVTTADVLTGAVHLEAARMGRADEMRAGAILRRLGWDLGGRESRNGARVRLYRPRGTGLWGPPEDHVQPESEPPEGWAEDWPGQKPESFQVSTLPVQPVQPDLIHTRARGGDHDP